jgi:DNA-directed RNA polymerase specialized sigma24 family protein
MHTTDIAEPANDDEVWARWLAVEQSIMKLCRWYTRGADSEAHKDLYQEIFLRVQRGYGDLVDKELFPSWVRRIADNVGNTWLKKMIVERSRRVLPNAEQEEQTTSMEAQPDPRPDAEKSLQVSETLSQGAAVLDCALQNGWLSRKEFDVIQERLRSDDESWEEIGAKLSLSKSDCASAHSRGISKLRTYLFVKHHHIVGGTNLLRAALNRALVQGAESSLSTNEQDAFTEIVINGDSTYHKSGWRTHLRGACDKISRQFSFDEHTIHLRRPASGGKMSKAQELNQLEVVLDGSRKCYLRKDLSRNPLLRGIVPAVLRVLRLELDPQRQVKVTESLGDVLNTLAQYQVQVDIRAHNSIEEVAMMLEQEHVPVLAVNAGDLLDDSCFYDFGATNDLLMPIQCYRNLTTSRVEGFAVFQTSSAELGFLSAQSISQGWLAHGGIVLDAFCTENFENLR